jgi:hypothetical protein
MFKRPLFKLKQSYLTDSISLSEYTTPMVFITYVCAWNQITYMIAGDVKMLKQKAVCLSTHVSCSRLIWGTVFVVRGITESTTSTAYCAWLPGAALTHFTGLCRLVSRLTGWETFLWNSGWQKRALLRCSGTSVSVTSWNLTFDLINNWNRYCCLLNVIASRLPLSRHFEYYGRSLVTSWLARLCC